MLKSVPWNTNTVPQRKRKEAGKKKRERDGERRGRDWRDRDQDNEMTDTETDSDSDVSLSTLKTRKSVLNEEGFPTYPTEEATCVHHIVWTVRKITAALEVSLRSYRMWSGPDSYSAALH